MTFSWAHVLGLLVPLLLLVPGLLTGAGVSYLQLIRYLEIIMPLLVAFLAVNLLRPDIRSSALERVAITCGSLGGILWRRASLLLMYVAAVILVIAGLALGSLGRLEQLSQVFLVSAVPSLVFILLTLWVLVVTGSSSLTMGAVSLVWGGMLLFTVMGAGGMLAILSPFASFGGYTHNVVLTSKALWSVVAILLIWTIARSSKHPYRLLTDR